MRNVFQWQVKETGRQGEVLLVIAQTLGHSAWAVAWAASVSVTDWPRSDARGHRAHAQ